MVSMTHLLEEVATDGGDEAGGRKKGFSYPFQVPYGK